MSLLLNKITYTFLMLILISLISFIAINLAPHSFLGGGELNPNITPESLKKLEDIYGLNRPLYEQYIGWLGSIFTLDFGVSFVSGAGVSEEILKRLPVTLIINVSAMFLVFALSMYLGIKSASKGGLFEENVKRASLVSFAMPSFYLAILLVLVFSYYASLFPISGLHSQGVKEGTPMYYIDMTWHLFLPVFVAVFGGFGSLTLYIRSLTYEIKKSDYYFFAKARGLDDGVILRYYVIPNLYPPIITILGLSLPGLIGGSVILETIFAIDGMGLLFYNAALSRDYPVIMGILIIGAFLTLLGNILADVALLSLNPYFKKGKKN